MTPSVQLKEHFKRTLNGFAPDRPLWITSRDGVRLEDTLRKSRLLVAAFEKRSARIEAATSGLAARLIEADERKVSFLNPQQHDFVGYPEAEGLVTSLKLKTECQKTPKSLVKLCKAAKAARKAKAVWLSPSVSQITAGELRQLGKCAVALAAFAEAPDWRHLIPATSVTGTLQQLGMRRENIVPTSFRSFSLARRLVEEPSYLQVRVFRDRKEFEL